MDFKQYTVKKFNAIIITCVAYQKYHSFCCNVISLLPNNMHVEIIQR